MNRLFVDYFVDESISFDYFVDESIFFDYFADRGPTGRVRKKVKKNQKIRMRHSQKEVVK